MHAYSVLAAGDTSWMVYMHVVSTVHLVSLTNKEVISLAYIPLKSATTCDTSEVVFIDRCGSRQKIRIETPNEVIFIMYKALCLANLQ